MLDSMAYSLLLVLCRPHAGVRVRIMSSDAQRDVVWWKSQTSPNKLHFVTNLDWHLRLCRCTHLLAIMSIPPLVRFVQAMSSVHAMKMSVRAGETTTAKVVGEVLFSREHFPKLLTATMALSGLTGYFTMEYIQRKKWEVSTAASVWSWIRQKSSSLVK